jgi:hypothetical protein
MILRDTVLKRSSAYRTKRGTDWNKTVLTGFTKIMLKEPGTPSPSFEIVLTHQAPWGVYDVDEVLDNVLHALPLPCFDLQQGEK